jgi:hypothetical protein
LRPWREQLTDSEIPEQLSNQFGMQVADRASWKRGPERPSGAHIETIPDHRRPPDHADYSGEESGDDSCSDHEFNNEKCKMSNMISYACPEDELFAKRLTLWRIERDSYINGMHSLGHDEETMQSLMDDFRSNFWNREMSIEGVNFALGISRATAPNTSFWYEMVTEYMRRNLTKSDDKLPALSGMATFVQDDRPGDIYLAGNWKQDLEKSLFWEAVPYEDAIKPVRLAPY